MIQSPVSVLFDEDGNPVSVVFDGSVYRLQVEAEIAAGTEVGIASGAQVGIDPAATGGLALEDTQLGKIVKETKFFYLGNGDIDKIETTIGSEKIVDQFSYVGGELSGIDRTVVPA